MKLPGRAPTGEDTGLSGELVSDEEDDIPNVDGGFSDGNTEFTPLSWAVNRTSTCGGVSGLLTSESSSSELLSVHFYPCFPFFPGFLALYKVEGNNGYTYFLSSLLCLF